MAFRAFFLFPFEENETMKSRQCNYVLAPIAGYTDLPFRRACRKFGLFYAHTALIDSGALVYGNPDNRHILARGDEEQWLAVQLLGCIPEHLKIAAGMLNDMPFDAVDFNMGCPVRKIQQRGAGVELMRHREQALDCVRLVRNIIKGPFTVKMRILDSVDPEPTVKLAQDLEQIGIDGLTIHGRLASKVYSGPVAVEVIRAVRETLHIPVTANGGIFNRGDAEWLAEQTGCSSLMVARGAIGNPWIFRELIQGDDTPPTHREIMEEMQEHVGGMVEMYGEPQGMVLARKIILGYVCGRGYPRALRANVGQIATWGQFMDFCRQLDAATATEPSIPPGINQSQKAEMNLSRQAMS